MKNGTKIYIPLWLDLLSEYMRLNNSKSIDLHSTMVRFIIMALSYIKPETL